MVSEASLNRYRVLVERIGLDQAQAIVNTPNERWREIKRELQAIGLNPTKKASVLAQKRLLTVVVHEIQQEQPTRAEIREIAETSWAEELTRLREENERLREEVNRERQQREELQEERDELREELRQMRELVNQLRQQPQQQAQQRTTQLTPQDLEELDEIENSDIEEEEIDDFSLIEGGGTDEIIRTNISDKIVNGQSYTVYERPDTNVQAIVDEIVADKRTPVRLYAKFYCRDQNGLRFTTWKELNDLVDIFEHFQVSSQKYGGRIEKVGVWAFW